MQFHLEQTNNHEWVMPIMNFDGGVRLIDSLVIVGDIANSVPTSETGKRNLKVWKAKVAKHVYDKRPSRQNPAAHYVLSVGMKFYPARRNYTFDIENYLKPIVDGLAAGLFCEEGTDPLAIERFNYDDSNFRNLWVARLPDARMESGEGIVITVCHLK